MKIFKPLRIHDFANQLSRVQLARDVASKILKEDPELNQKKNAILKETVLKQLSKEVDWSKVS